MFSNDNDYESTKKSDGLIIRTSELILNRKLTNKEKNIYTSKYVVLVRKTAHFTLYFLLGLFFCSFLKEFDSFYFFCASCLNLNDHVVCL